MSKKVVRLTESELKQLIYETVWNELLPYNETLDEGRLGNFMKKAIVAGTLATASMGAMAKSPQTAPYDYNHGYNGAPRQEMSMQQQHQQQRPVRVYTVQAQSHSKQLAYNAARAKASNAVAESNYKLTQSFHKFKTGPNGEYICIIYLSSVDDAITNTR